MHLIRCTSKLATEMGLKKKDLFEDEVPQTGLGDWYANLFKLSRYKCVIFTNALTLYSFVVFRVGKTDIQNLSELFREFLFFNLMHEGLATETVRSVLQGSIEVLYAPTSSRVVLGSMNDLVNCYGAYLEHAEEITPESLLTTNARINRMPMKSIGYNYPVEELHKALVFRA